MIFWEFPLGILMSYVWQISIDWLYKWWLDAKFTANIIQTNDDQFVYAYMLYKMAE